MKTLNLFPGENPSAIKTAANLLQNGEIVVIPTETVYGLAADAFNAEAVAKIFIAKGRPQDNPLIVHISDFSEIDAFADSSDARAEALAKAFWPGPFTMILPKKDTLPDNVTAGLDTVAVRMPSHPVARAIIRESGLPLAAPSANISGFPSPTCFQHAADDMTGRAAAIVDGGDCAFGVESTVITLATPVPRLLRPGAVTAEQIRSVIGTLDIDEAVLHPLADGAQAASPGMKHRHYSPKADITVVKGSLSAFADYVRIHAEPDTYILCFEEEKELFGKKAVPFGFRDDALSQTAALFPALRRLDELGAKNAFARCPSADGVGLAVCNRLFRAAGFKMIE